MLLSMFGLFAVSFPLVLLLHTLVPFCYLAFCFSFSLHYSLSCCVLLFLVPFLRAISRISAFPDNGQRFTKHCQLQCTVLTQTKTHQCQTGDWLCFPPSFSFSLPFGLVLSLLLSLCSFSRSLSLCCWPLGSTEQNWFPLFHGSWVRHWLRNTERGRGQEREKERGEYVIHIFVHLYLHYCLSPKKILLLVKPIPQQNI